MVKYGKPAIHITIYNVFAFHRLIDFYVFMDQPRWCICLDSVTIVD